MTRAGATSCSEPGITEELLAEAGYSADLAGTLDAVKATVLIRPEGGHPRPAGQGGRAGAARARLLGHSRRARRAHGRARGRGRRPSSPRSARSSSRTPDRGLRDRQRRLVRFGVIQFPGSCDERDALLGVRAGRRGADGLARGHRPLRDRRRRRPRGLLLWRLPAGRRDRALLAGDGSRGASSRPPGGHVLGICNGFQVLCEAGLLPGRAASQRGPSLHLPPGGAGRRERRDPVHPRVRARRAALDPGQAHVRPLLRAAGDARRARGARPGRPALRAGPEPQRLRARRRRRPQRGRQRARPDAPPRARRRPAHRLGRRPAPVHLAGRPARAAA